MQAGNTADFYMKNKDKLPWSSLQATVRRSTFGPKKAAKTSPQPAESPIKESVVEATAAAGREVKAVTAATVSKAAAAAPSALNLAAARATAEGIGKMTFTAEPRVRDFKTQGMRI